jgi:hypothetical protein
MRIDNIMLNAQHRGNGIQWWKPVLRSTAPATAFFLVIPQALLYSMPLGFYGLTYLIILSAVVVALASSAFEIHWFWWCFYLIVMPILMAMREERYVGLSDLTLVPVSRAFIVYGAYVVLLAVVRKITWRFAKPNYRLEESLTES